MRMLGGATRALAAALVLAVAGLATGCEEDALTDGAAPTPSGSARGSLPALSPELRKKVLAKVGDRVITLGDYAATLDRMDRFERLRYQSDERRKVLLEEMIKVELLAKEAERRGLDKEPATKQHVRQILRDQVIRDLQAKVPPPGEIAEARVRKYYDENRDDFREPERRRVAHIVLGTKKKAEEVLAKARKATPLEWGKLVQAHSLNKPPKPSPTASPELAGDLGIVGPPGNKRGANPKVSEALRAAVFKIEKVGGVLGEVVEDDGKFHIVRMMSKTAARDRTFKEAERTIRVALVQQEIRNAEKALEESLRKKFKVEIDESALAKVKVPDRPRTGGSGGGKKP